MHLQFENVRVDDDNCYRVTICLGGVHKMTCDGSALDVLHMESDDGSVIAFRRSGNTAEMAVTWTSYAPRTDKVRLYAFDFASFDLRAERQDWV